MCIVVCVESAVSVFTQSKYEVSRAQWTTENTVSFFFFFFLSFFVLRGKEDKDVCDLRTTSQWVVVMKWRSKRDDKLCQRDVKTTSHRAESCQEEPIYIYIYVYVIMSLSGEPRKEKEKKSKSFFFWIFIAISGKRRREHVCQSSRAWAFTCSYTLRRNSHRVTLTVQPSLSLCTFPSRPERPSIVYA